MAKTSEVGGESALGLAGDWTTALQQLLNTGGIGTAGGKDGPGATGDIMSVLSDILAGGKGAAGSALAQLVGKSDERNVNALRARFTAGGGSSMGTPAAYAESLYRGEAAPHIAQAITGLQLQAILPLLGYINQTANKGITQRQLIQSKSPFGQALDVIGGVAKSALPFVSPAFGAGLFSGNNIPDAPLFPSTAATTGFGGTAPPEIPTYGGWQPAYPVSRIPGYAIP